MSIIKNRDSFLKQADVNFRLRTALQEGEDFQIRPDLGKRSKTFSECLIKGCVIRQDDDRGRRMLLQILREL